MPSLTVETSGLRRGGVITSRVLIGRLPTNGVVLAESSVSRLHAWIDCDLEGLYYVADTGSLTGTWLNNKAVERRHALHDGDVIRVGKTLLTFHETNDLAADVQPMNLAGYPPLEDVDQAGVLFECVCGAPAWFKATAIGQTHKCRQCERSVIIPDKPGVRAHPVGEPVAAEVFAGHGLAEAYAGESVTTAAGAATELRHPHDEHGLGESFAGQTVVAEAEPQTGFPDEHGIAEIQPPHDAGETAYTAESETTDFDFSSASDTADHHAPPAFAADNHAPYGDQIFSEPAMPSPTLDQLLEREPQIAVEPAAEIIPEESFGAAETPEVSAEFSAEAEPAEHAAELPSEEAIAPAAERDTLESAEAPPLDVVTAIHDELGAPPAETAPPPEQTEPPAPRPSLFARRRPLAEPHPVSTDEPVTEAAVAEVSPVMESGAVAETSAPALDPFDGDSAEDSSGSVAAAEDPAYSHSSASDVTHAAAFSAQDDEAVGAQNCSVCHTVIAAHEATTTCPSCGLTFHSECWQENHGCSAYGCPQVGAMAPKEQPQTAEQTAAGTAAAYDATEPDEPFPWEFLYLGASIVGTLLGLLVFGIPAVIAAFGTLIYKLRFPDPARRNGVVTLAILLAVLGAGLGFVASVYWWFGGFAHVDWGRLRGK